MHLSQDQKDHVECCGRAFVFHLARPMMLSPSFFADLKRQGVDMTNFAPVQPIPRPEQRR